MKKNTTLIVGIIVVIVLVVGGVALLHKSPKTVKVSTTSSAAPGSAVVVNNAVLITKTDGTLGAYLATPAGVALYTYGADTNGVSNCTGSCLASWPAYQDTGATTGLPAGVSTLTRTDNGMVQYTYNGMPLYTFVGDSSGKVTGNGVSNFTVAKPTTTAPAASSTPAASPGSNNY